MKKPLDEIPQFVYDSPIVKEILETKFSTPGHAWRKWGGHDGSLVIKLPVPFLVSEVDRFWYTPVEGKLVTVESVLGTSRHKQNGEWVRTWQYVLDAVYE